MAIYGTALLSICLIVGLVMGQWLGVLVGVNTNVGGVGIAMGKVTKAAVAKLF